MYPSLLSLLPLGVPSEFYKKGPLLLDSPSSVPRISIIFEEDVYPSPFLHRAFFGEEAIIPSSVYLLQKGTFSTYGKEANEVGHVCDI